MNEPSPSTDWLQRERDALDLVERALERPEGERAGWIEAQTEVSPELRSRALKLLDLALVTTSSGAMGAPEARRGSRDLADVPTRAIDPDAPARRPTPHSAGDMIGNYQIDRELGRGGMGIVYRAHRADQSFELAVALKVMQILPGQAVDRFEAERKILARLDHPNIARILDGGYTDQGSPYLVMELVEGLPIDEYCDQQRLSVADRIELFRKVCDAVLHAHRRLVVHRDLKPGNILVTDKAQPKLLDFGIAKLLDLDQPGATLTHFGLGPMTPEYASPEQVRQEPITISTDVYSLGVILFQLLTGRRPYSFTDRSLRSIERAICDTRPPSPSRLLHSLGDEAEISLAKLRATSRERLERELTGDLDAIVLKALEKNPADRYGSVEDFSEDLESLLEGKPVKARAQTWTYLTSRFLARHKRRVALAVTVLLVTLGALAVGVAQSLRAAAEGRRALLEAQKRERTNSFLDSLFTAPDPMWGLGKDTTVVQLLDVAIEGIESGELLADTPSVLRTIGSTYDNLGLSDKAVRVLERAEQESIRNFGEDHFETAHTRQRLANVVAALGENERAAELIEKALPVFERENHQDLSVVESQYANQLAGIGAFEEAERYFERATKHNAERAEPTMDDVINLNNYGVFLLTRGRRDEAAQKQRAALALHREMNAPPSPLFASMLANAGSDAELNGDLAKADSLYQESASLCDSLLGEDHPQTITTKASLINLYIKMGRLDQARILADRLLQVAQTSLPEGHPILAYAQVVHAGVLLDQGEGAAAEPQLRSAIASREASLPEGHWLVASAQNLLGKSFIQQGRLGEAKELLTRTYAALLEAVGPDHEKTIQAAQLLEVARSQNR